MHDAEWQAEEKTDVSLHLCMALGGFEDATVHFEDAAVETMEAVVLF